MLNQHEQNLETPVMPTYNRFPITLTKGKGSYVWDDVGNKYLDYTAGIATCNLGHRPENVQKAVEQQLNNLWHCSNLYTIPTQTALAEQLVMHSCGDQVFFCNSGAEANEAAIKIVRRYAQKINQTDHYEIVTFHQSFHGRTLATLSATGQQKVQEGFQPAMPGFRYLPYNDRGALNDLIGPKTCAVMLELVQGEGGVIPADQDWINELVQLCEKHNILIIVDEIQTGMGRTGTLFAYQQYGLNPDVITVAKGLGSGFAIGAMIAKAEVAQAFTPGTHGSTFGGNPLATTAGLTTIETLTQLEFLPSVQKKVAYFWGELENLAKHSALIKSVRGKGFLIGLEVNGKAIDFVHEARVKHNLLILVAGENVVRILPPLTTTIEELDDVIEKLKQIF